MKTRLRIIPILFCLLFIFLFDTDTYAASINKQSISIYVGKSTNLKLNGTKLKRTSTSKKQIATINSKGKVIGKKAGTCYVYLYGRNGIKYRCKVKVVNPYISKSSIKITRNKSYQLKLKGSTVSSVYSSNNSIATINNSCTVVAKKCGTCNVYVVGTNKKTYKCKVKVEAPYLNNTNISLTVSSKYDLNLKGTAKVKKWYSSNSGIASITSSGVITGMREGSTSVYVLCDGIKYYCNVTVSLASNILKNKKISIIGDSISTYKGYNPAGYPAKYAMSNVTSVYYTWWHELCRRTSMSLLKNCSWSGSLTIGNSTSTTSAKAGCSTKRITDLASGSSNPDIIICYIGTNDYGKNSALGTWHQTKYNLTDKTNVTTFSEAYALMLNKIKKTYPNAVIYCCNIIQTTNYNIKASSAKNNIGITLSQYNNVISNISSHFNVNVINLYGCGINYSNLNIYTSDNVHPNRAGMNVISNYVYRHLINNYTKDLNKKLAENKPAPTPTPKPTSTPVPENTPLPSDSDNIEETLNPDSEDIYDDSSLQDTNDNPNKTAEPSDETNNPEPSPSSSEL